jgi:cell division septation protein DedD
MVGKRLEGRERVAHKAATSAQVDPLAALDELGADEQAEGKGDDLAFAAALAADAKKAAPALAVAPTPKAASAPAVAPDVAQPAKEAKEAKEPKEAPAKEAKDSKDKDSADKPKEKKGKFTLQISSFQERADADALVAKLGASGYKPYLIMSNVPDKGVFFRVRIGEFTSKSDAQDAKSEFEKKQHLLAYVTKM